jgi:nicotinamide mononucleotide transporter
MMSPSVFQQIAEQFLASSALELTAVILAVLYLVLVVKEDIRCWYAAFLSTAIFLVIFWDVNLYMESGLQIYYLLMAVFGWYQWRASALPDVDALPISRWSTQNHFIAIFTIISASAISGYLLSNNTNASLPYLDSFTTWASVLTTYMVTKKIYENWAYWLVIDTVSIYLYLDRGLYFTALLFSVYIIIIGFGWYSWSQKLAKQPSKV